VAVGGGGPSLVDGKNNSRASEPAETERYDCRDEFDDMFYRGPEGDRAEYRCGSWDCYCCAHRMRMNLIEEMERLVRQRPELRRFLTLTVGEKGPSDVDAQHKYLTERFNALRTELRDRYPDLSYIWVRHEGDENGRPHLHLLVDRYLPQDELSLIASRTGLGEVVDIRRVNARNAAKYLTSYLGKGALAQLPDGARRYGSSAGIDLDVRGNGGDGDEPSDWRLLKDDPYTDIARPVVKADFIRDQPPPTD
jgi:hypothetical protein